LKPCEVNQAGSHVPLATCELPKAKTAATYRPLRDLRQGAADTVILLAEGAEQILRPSP
jgi:hypothetical protein